ncbi:MAG: RDD family protein [Elainellaceae cyanobacterium]
MHTLNRFTLKTPERVELEFTLAGIGNRAFALCIDYMLWMLIMTGFILLWSFLLDTMRLLIVNELNADADTVIMWMGAIALLIFFGIYIGYFVVFETLWQGQTPGKRIAKIRVIRQDGRPIGLVQATMRALLRPVDDFPFLGLVGGLLIFFVPREKRLGDFIAGTLVVLQEQPPSADALPLAPQSTQLAAELPGQSDLSHLMPDDFAVVREYLQRRRELAPKAKESTSLNLARQVRSRIKMKELPEGTTPDRFLEAIYLAYQEKNR